VFAARRRSSVGEVSFLVNLKAFVLLTTT